MKTKSLLYCVVLIVLAACGRGPAMPPPPQGASPIPRATSLQPVASAIPPTSVSLPQGTSLPPTSAQLTNSAEAAKAAQWVKDLPPVGAEQNHFSAIGVISMHMLFGPARDALMQKGPAAFYADASIAQKAKENYEHLMRQILPVMKAGGIIYLRDVQNFPWGMLEPQKGQYEFGLSDAIVLGAQSQGLEYVGVAMPFAGWDLAALGPADEICQHFFQEDYPYLAYDGAMGRYQDLDAFIVFLGKLVERYDGDGVDDAPGLQRGIKFWQIHNEPEGGDCGQFRNDPQAFVELMRRSYEAVHAACVDCQVMNGGAAIPLWKGNQFPGANFWEQYVELGGAPYLDVIALHYNEGKHDETNGQVVDFETQVSRLRGLLGTDKPVWVTEFGVIVGDEAGVGRFHFLSETEAASWYMRFYAAGLASGVTRFFSDSMSFYNFKSQQILLPFYVNKLMEAKIGAFTEAGKLADGQYRFMVNGSPVYVLWNGIPSDLTGTVTVTDMYGNSSEMDASTLQPSESSPLIVEQK